MPESRCTDAVAPIGRKAARAVVAGCVFGGLVAAPASASAQDLETVLGSRHRDVESPQNFALEVRFSPYRPDIDSDPALRGAKPYEDTFGSLRRLMIGAELDWQAFRIPYVGTIGPGVGVGYTSMQDEAFTKTTPPVRSGEETSIDIIPFYAVGVLRVDSLMRDLKIPFVPYGKLGVSYALWRAYNSLGTSSANSVSGKGNSTGTHAALGLALHLNSFDQSTARAFDERLGVNHTYLYAEYLWSNLDGFGGKDLRVGASTWVLGLAMEF